MTIYQIYRVGFYGMLRFNAFSYSNIAHTRLQETPNSEYPNYIRLGYSRCHTLLSLIGLYIHRLSAVIIGCYRLTQVGMVLPIYRTNSNVFSFYIL